MALTPNVFQGETLMPVEGDKLRLTVSQRMPLDPNAVAVALQRSGNTLRCTVTACSERAHGLAGEDSGGCIFVVYMWMQSAVLRYNASSPLAVTLSENTYLVCGAASS